MELEKIRLDIEKYFFGEEESSEEILKRISDAFIDCENVENLIDVEELLTRKAALFNGRMDSRMLKKALNLTNGIIRSFAVKTSKNEGYYKDRIEQLDHYIREVEETTRHMGRQNLVLSYFYQASQMISASLNLDYIISSIVEMIVNIFSDCFCCMLNVDSEENLYASPQNPPGNLRFTEYFNSNVKMKVCDGCEGRCVDEQSPYQIYDVYNDESYVKYVHLADQFGYQSVLSVPLIIRGNAEGCISIYSHEKRFFPEEEIRILVMFSDQAARAIENARLYKKTDDNLQSKVSELSLMHEIDQLIINNEPVSRVTSTLILGMEKVFSDYGFAIDLSKVEKGLMQSNQLFDEFGVDEDSFHISNEEVLSTNAFIEKEIFNEYGVLRMYGLPIAQSGECTGSFWIVTDDPGGDHVEILEFAKWILAQISIALEKSTTLNQLIHAEKMNVLGSMLSGITHELNNPLSRILGVTEMAKETSDLNEIGNHLEIIRNESLRSKRIMEDFLAFARKYKSNKTPVQIGQVIEDTIQLWNYQKKNEDMQVIFQISQDLPDVFINVNRIQQVFLNLIVNAYYALSTVTKQGKYLRIKTESSDGKVIISFEDNGPGIDRHHISKVFQPFFTTKEKGKGTGLGLSLSRDIIKEHNGRIWVDSRKGEWTAFYIEFPAYMEAEKKEKKQNEPQKSLLEGASVLVAEDDVLIMKFVTAFLRKIGFKVEKAENGRVCLEKLRDADFDIIVTDMVMPDLRGDQMIDILREEKPEILKKLILCTGDVLDKDRLSDFEGLGIQVLYKPFELVELKKVMEKIL